MGPADRRLETHGLGEPPDLQLANNKQGYKPVICAIGSN
jgi:hypothetical protein